MYDDSPSFLSLCQALQRKVQELGLQTTYTDNSKVRSFVRRTAAIAFIPLR